MVITIYRAVVSNAPVNKPHGYLGELHIITTRQRPTIQTIGALRHHTEPLTHDHHLAVLLTSMWHLDTISQWNINGAFRSAFSNHVPYIYVYMQVSLEGKTKIYNARVLP